MSVESKRIAKNTGLLYFRMLLLMVVSLYTSRILLQSLGIVDYGIYNVVGGLVVMVGFLQGTMGTASSRFITVSLAKGQLDDMRLVFSSIFLVNIALAIIVLILTETIGLWFLTEKMIIPQDRFQASLWVYQFSAATIFLNIVLVPFYSTIIAHEKMKAFAYLSFFDAFAKLTIVFVISSCPYDRLIFYSFLMTCVSIFDILVYFLYCFKRFEETRVQLLFDKGVIGKIFRFVIWSSYGSFASVGFTQGLNIILNMFFGPSVNAARGVAVQVQNAVTNFTTNFQLAINPQIISTTTQKRFEDTQKLVIASSKYSFFLLCILGFPIIAETPFILTLWLKDIPDYSVSFCRIVLLISIFGSLANPLRIVNQAEGNIKKFQLYECSLLLSIMPAAWCILEIWQIPILVFVVHLVIDILAQFIRLYIVLPKIRMSFSYYNNQVIKKIIPVIFIPLIFVLITNLINREECFGIFLLMVLSVEILTLCVIFIFGLTNQEKAYVKLFISTNICKIVKRK